MTALWFHRDRHLVSSQVLKAIRIPKTQKPTPQRVGQILKSLHAFGYTTREARRFQGRRDASFYKLTQRGERICRDRYGLGRRRERFLPPLNDDTRQLLSGSHFNGDAHPPARKTIGFYSYNGGVGQTSMVAYTGYGLAQEASRKKVLIIDFDFESPQLNKFFLTTSRQDQGPFGFQSLLEDYSTYPEWQKEIWLAGALEGERYIHQPFPNDRPNLYFLPTGMATGTGQANAGKRRRTLEFLQKEVRHLQRNKRVGDTQSFFTVLKEHLLKRFDLILFDVQAGRSQAAVGVLSFADQLVLNTRPSENPRALESLRLVLAHFLKNRQQDSKASAGAMLVMHLSEFGRNDFDGVGWLQNNLLLADQDPEIPKPSKIWTHRRSRRLEKSEGWILTRIYLPLVHKLLGSRAHRTYRSPDSIAIERMLDPKLSENDAEIFTSLLERLSFSEFARNLEIYAEETSHLSSNITLERIKKLAAEQLSLLFQVKTRSK